MKEYVQEHADEIREGAWEEGLAEGRAEGRAEGHAEGQEEATVRLNKLYSCLLTSGRADDLQRALKDPVYLKQLLQEFWILMVIIRVMIVNSMNTSPAHIL